MIDLPILPTERARLEALKAKVRKLKQQRDEARAALGATVLERRTAARALRRLADALDPTAPPAPPHEQ